MPSKFEPCGLSQMIAMRYGSVPVVRETGGLKDTVEPYNPMEKTGVGFTFKTYNAYDMLDAVWRAYGTFICWTRCGERTAPSSTRRTGKRWSQTA